MCLLVSEYILHFNSLIFKKNFKANTDNGQQHTVTPCEGFLNVKLFDIAKTVHRIYYSQLYI